MLPDTVQEILTTLRDLEQQETLLLEANFVERVYALDVLSFRVLEHIVRPMSAMASTNLPGKTLTPTTWIYSSMASWVLPAPRKKPNP